MWLEPYPDLLLEGVEDTAPGPDARVEAREAISLAFVAALQLLAPRQRAVLVLRDVLGFRAKEVAAMLDTSEESVSSALRHARANLHSRLAPPADPPPAPDSQAERAIIDNLVTAYEAGDVPALVSLLTDDVVVTAPLIAGACTRRSSPRTGPTAWFPPGPTGSPLSGCTSGTRRPECFTPTGWWSPRWPAAGSAR